MEENKEIVKNFLKKCSINYENIEEIDGMMVPRDTLLSQDRYEGIKEDIEKMKKLYSSGSLTSLQKNAKDNQKWPLLNLVRQILKSNDFQMEPVRKSNGYTPEGKKKYLRFFKIKKIVKKISKVYNICLTHLIVLKKERKQE